MTTTIQTFPWIETYTGKIFNFLSPNQATICIEDIAQGLGNQCRYNGQCHNFYSVAEHSVLMAQYYYQSTFGNVNPSICLAVLLHDAAEAYIGDYPRPLKLHIPPIRDIEQKIQYEIYKKFDIPVCDYINPIIKELDKRVVIDERQSLFNVTSHTWATTSLLPLGVEIIGIEPRLAIALFMDTFTLFQQQRSIGAP